MEGKGNYLPITLDKSKLDIEVLFNVLDSVENAIIIIDTHANVVYINREYTNRLGISPEKILGRNLRKIEPAAKSLRVLKTLQPVYNEPDYVKSLKINAIGVSIPLYDKNGELFGAADIFNNVTELMKMAQKLERSREIADYLQEQLREIQLPWSFREYICENGEMKKMLHLAAKVSHTDSTVLILGESGVGKEVMAKAIHLASKRGGDPLIKVNCASIPENLLESELFGYEDGAFTGAKRGGKMGKFELANGGTIFLDEIGDMSLSMQAKLLRVLQERELERVGGTRSISLDIRVIAATNQNLKEMIKANTFRSDLYYRLNVVTLTILPLRERKEDILPLSSYFLSSKSPGEKVALSNSVIGMLLEYNWPGNVRELENVLEYANIIRSDDTVTIKDLPQYLKPDMPIEEVANAGRYNIKAATAVLERDYMVEAIKACQGNRSQAIKELGISRRAFYQKLEKYGLSDLVGEKEQELN